MLQLRYLWFHLMQEFLVELFNLKMLHLQTKRAKKQRLEGNQNAMLMKTILWTFILEIFKLSKKVLKSSNLRIWVTILLISLGLLLELHLQKVFHSVRAQTLEDLAAHQPFKSRNLRLLLQVNKLMYKRFNPKIKLQGGLNLKKKPHFGRKQFKLFNLPLLLELYSAKMKLLIQTLYFLQRFP